MPGQTGEHNELVSLNNGVLRDLEASVSVHGEHVVASHVDDEVGVRDGNGIADLHLALGEVLLVVVVLGDGHLEIDSLELLGGDGSGRGVVDIAEVDAGGFHEFVDKACSKTGVCVNNKSSIPSMIVSRASHSKSHITVRPLLIPIPCR